MIGEGQVTSLDVDVVIRGLPGSAGAVAAITTIGIIDTGADKVLIPLGYAKKLGLKPINNIMAFLASGEGRPAINYAGVLEIPAIGYSKPIEMTAITEGVRRQPRLAGQELSTGILGDHRLREQPLLVQPRTRTRVVNGRWRIAMATLASSRPA